MSRLGTLLLGEGARDTCALCAIDEPDSGIDAGLTDAGTALDAEVADAGGELGDAALSDAALDDAGPPLMNGYFVDPLAGLDTQAGTQGAPFKTLAQAASLATAGQTIYLLDGTYDLTNQPTFQLNLAAGVTLRGLTPTGVTLRGDGVSNQLTFTSGGGLHNVRFESFLQALEVRGSGTFDMSNVQFDDVGVAMFIKGTVNAVLDGTARQMLLNPTQGGGQLFWIEEQAQVEFHGDLANLNTTGNALFLVRGSAFLSVRDSAFSNIDRRIYNGYDNAHLSMRNVTMDDIAWPGQNPFGAESAVLTAGGQNTAQPLDNRIELANCSITNSQLTGIIFTLYSNLATQGLIRITDSHIDSNTGYGIRVVSALPADPDLNMLVDLSSTTLIANGGAGLSLTSTNLTVFGGEISGNTGDGIQMLDAAAKNSIQLRSVALRNNTGDGVFFHGAATSSFDLGRTINLGSNEFGQIPFNQSAVSLLAPIVGYAIGNVWMPNVQGSTPSGIFTTPTSFSDTSGVNANVDASASLVVYE